MTQNALDRMELMLAEQSRRFHARLLQPAFPNPSFLPARLGPFQKAAGALFDWAAARMFRQRDARPGAGSTVPDQG